MSSAASRIQGLGRTAGLRARVWWRIAQLGATILALAFTRQAWTGRARAALVVQVWRATWPLLPGYTLAAALLCLVITRIVLVTAVSYGLSQVALEMVVRVLVLELIPLTAALFVAVRYAIPAAVELTALRRDDALVARREAGGNPLAELIGPRALAAMFAVLLLAAASGVIALVLAYLLAYGFTPWAFARYTRLVGQVFSPVVSLLFVIKTLAFAAAVSVVPVGSALHDREGPPGSGAEIQGLVRMFVVLLLVEALSLMGNYI